MTLTEQWNKGELEIDKNYYLRFADGTEEIQLYVGAFLMRADNEVVEVLAPVPSYEEWRDIEDDLATCDKDLNNVCEQKEELYEENQQLKGYNEYLRNIIIECEPYIENVCTALNMEKFANGGFLHKSNELLSKIRTAIGEKK